MVGSFWRNLDAVGCPGTRVMTICGSYVGRHFANIQYFDICGGIWRYIKLFGSIWMYMKVYNNIWPFFLLLLTSLQSSDLMLHIFSQQCFESKGTSISYDSSCTDTICCMVARKCVKSLNKTVCLYAAARTKEITNAAVSASQAELWRIFKPTQQMSVLFDSSSSSCQVSRLWPCKMTPSPVDSSVCDPSMWKIRFLHVSTFSTQQQFPNWRALLARRSARELRSRKTWTTRGGGTPVTRLRWGVGIWM